MEDALGDRVLVIGIPDDDPKFETFFASEMKEGVDLSTLQLAHNKRFGFALEGVYDVSQIDMGRFLSVHGRYVLLHFNGAVIQRCTWSDKE
jgi:hypothetical protein